jgi:membrane protein YqaA with SNARE-associated domain
MAVKELIIVVTSVKERVMEASLQMLFSWLAMPLVGLPALGLVAFLAATFLPVGAEPVLLGYLELVPEDFWWAILVASIGNTLGGLFTYWMGFAGRNFIEARRKGSKKQDLRVLVWLEKFGPKTLLFSWVPVIGDAIAGLAGWVRLPLLPCTAYMLIGKTARYVLIAYLYMVFKP